DVEDLVRININRLLHVVDQGALVLVAVSAFWLTTLLVMAFWYDIEFAQAVVFLAAPMLLVVWFSVRASRRIVAEAATGEALHRRLNIHRRIVQVIGMISIA